MTYKCQSGERKHLILENLMPVGHSRDSLPGSSRFWYLMPMAYSCLLMLWDMKIFSPCLETIKLKQEFLNCGFSFLSYKVRIPNRNELFTEILKLCLTWAADLLRDFLNLEFLNSIKKFPNQLLLISTCSWRHHLFNKLW